MQNTIINQTIEDIRRDLVKIRQASKRDLWSREERCTMQKVFSNLETNVALLRYRAGMS